MTKTTGRQTQNLANPFFATPVFQVFTIGIPFCVFKLMFGLLALRASGGALPLRVFAWLIIVWAALDLMMNLARVFYFLAGRPAPIEYCTIAQAGRLAQSPRLFLAIDTLVSFAIICFVLWSGWITKLSTGEAYLWYAATTMNLISVSLVNIALEIDRAKQAQ